MHQKLLFLITEDKWFLTHRLTLANLAKSNGYEVIVVTKVTKYLQAINEQGYRVIPLTTTRGGTNPFKELQTIIQLIGIYRREKPVYVHHIGIKNITYGTIAARLTNVAHIVNAFAGLGLIFTNSGAKSNYLRAVIVHFLRILLKKHNISVIFQNPDDMKQLLDMGVVSKPQANLIRSSGVNLDRFAISPEPPGPIILVMAGRLLWPKGVGVLADAARILKENGHEFTIKLVGAPDPENPSSVQETQLLKWQNEGLLQWVGYQENMVEVWKNCHIALLPSFYGEGVPKVLLEAAACGRPLIATDSTGCREIAINNYNAITVPPKDADALARAIIRLVNDSAERIKMGQNSRKLVEEHFSDQMVAEQTISLYKSMK